MEVFTLIKKNTYQDSMKLMQLQAALQKVPGVILCGVAMATPENKAQFKIPGLLTPDMEQATPSDLCIIVQGETADAVARVREEVDKYFAARGVSEGYAGAKQILPRSIGTALKRLPQANLAFISVPGAYAPLEATKALQGGLHVFLFSDNVSIAEEVELKTLAAQKGLLVMGPDCGTAILSGVPLGFANRVRKGKIGMVAASGTGLQEVSCLIHRWGEGISQAIGTGGRDLSAEVGGMTFAAGLQALLADDETKVIVLMSKHCDEKSAAAVIEPALHSSKALVVYFPGSDSFLARYGEKIHRASHLEHVAALSVALARGNPLPAPVSRESILREMGAVIESAGKKFSSGQKYLRALYTGGTFADQAKVILPAFLQRLYAHPASGSTVPLENPSTSRENCIVDLGDDVFTRGKVHPMIDPTTRNERILKEGEDPTVRVFLLDLVLGYGSHSDPAGSLAETILHVRKTFSCNCGGEVVFVVSICGTDEDPQNCQDQKRKLEDAGAIVTDSSTKAAFLAGWIAAK